MSRVGLGKHSSFNVRVKRLGGVSGSRYKEVFLHFYDRVWVLGVDFGSESQESPLS